MDAVSLLEWGIDGLLGLGLLGAAWRALTTPRPFEGIVWFIAFSLLMALAWVRLHAPDIALAEAAIGAGLTGALLLAALGRLRAMGDDPGAAEEPSTRDRAAWQRALLAVAPVLVVAGLAAAVGSLPTHAAGLSGEASTNLEASGAMNPVTAVLLDFRGYDTLLETFVLLLALLGVWSLRAEPAPPEAPSSPVQDVLARLLAPLLILVTAYLVWVGAHAPGGAFQAGAVLGAAGVLLLLSGWRLPARLAGAPLRAALLLGPGTFAALAGLGLMLEGHMLDYPPRHADTLVKLLEVGATLSIGVTLAALFFGSRPSDEGGRP